MPIVLANGRPLSAMASTFELGNEQALTSYDASYLDLAMTHNLPLATNDKALLKAAKCLKIKIFSSAV